MAQGGFRVGSRRLAFVGWLGAGMAVLLGGGPVGCGDAPRGASTYAWLELGPGGARIARAVTGASLCPALEVDGRSLAMAVRAAPAPPLFPVLTCEAEVPAGAGGASIDGAALPLPRADTRRIAVIGDTGCRIEDGHVPQACNDPHAWPFAGLSRAVVELVGWLTGAPARGDFADLAQSVAALDPDLIVHVGDYLYREDACPEDDPGCAGSPYGYDWATIEADFFAPARPMLRAAPLALTRGNHESCDRAGAVWFRFFDPRPFGGQCADYTEPYAIDLGDLQLLELDSSAASDTSVDPAQVARYRAQFDELRRLAGPRALFVTHRPMWVFGHLKDEGGREVLFRDNATLQAAAENALPAGVEAVLSGHVHLYELLGFESPRPPQLVVGNSGTELDLAVTTPLAGLEIGGDVVAFGDTLDQFGFATLEADGAAWRATIRDMSGGVLRQCALSAGRVSCS